jgi:hydroxyethylthiazole kinase-like uncharacterized protein yjeF
MENWKMWSADDARRFIAIPTSEEDKYSRGVLGVIAGSIDYPGAAILTSSAALRTGIGLLRYIGPRKVTNFVLARNPEVVPGIGRVNAWVIGPGLPSGNLTYSQKRQISSACKSGQPICLDAGALNFVDKIPSPTLITPHYRELQSLLTSKGIPTTLMEICDNPKFWARRTALEFGVTVLLKGNVSVVASIENQIELPSATPWLATAGTGDVLAGIIGALMATNSLSILNQKIDLASIAATASFIHNRAAEFAIFQGPITSTDVVMNISRAIFEIIK